MKQNLLKILLLASSVTMALASCGETPSNPSETPSNPSVETPSTPSVETPSTPSVENPSTPSDSSGEEEIEKIIVELSRYIYLEGESAYDYVTRFDVYSAALGGYKTKLKNYSVTMPEECPNGEATITVSAGKDSKDVTIYYYKDAKTAAENTVIQLPDDTSTLFDEASYVSETGVLTFEATENNGNVLVHKADANANKINSYQSIVYNSNIIEIWNDPTLLENGYYDETKKTLKHYSEDANGITTDFYNCTYAPTTDMELHNVYNYEIIVDGEGKIAYLGAINYTTGTMPSIAAENYWSYYKDPATNPALTFADDYDAEANPTAFQKVLPEGGFWIVGYNNDPGHTFGGIDKLWCGITGMTKVTLYSQDSSIKLTMDDENVEYNLMNARITNNKRKIGIYNPADVYQRYAYYYSLALTSNDSAKLALRDEIYNAILMQKIPEVQKEEVLKNYYEAITSAKLDEWAKLFVTK